MPGKCGQMAQWVSLAAAYGFLRLGHVSCLSASRTGFLLAFVFPRQRHLGIGFKIAAVLGRIDNG